MTVFCTHCGAQLAADARHCTQCGSAVALSSAPIAARDPQPPIPKRDRRWLWWVPFLILFFALGYWLALLLAHKCPSCAVPPGDAALSGRSVRGSGTASLANGPPQKLGNGAGQGPAESAGGSATGEIDGAGKIIPHEFAVKDNAGNNTGHKSQDGEPTPDRVFHSGGEDAALFGEVAQLAKGVAPYGSPQNSGEDNPGARTQSFVAYDFTYDETNLPRYPDNVRDVASSISYALDSKTGDHTGAFGTGAGLVTMSSFDDVVGWYRKNVPAGWQSSSVGDFGQLAQQATQGPSADLMKLLKGEMPGAPANDKASPAAPKVRVALFKAPATAGGPPNSTIMIIQRDDKPVTVYLQTQVK